MKKLFVAVFVVILAGCPSWRGSLEKTGALMPAPSPCYYKAGKIYCPKDLEVKGAVTIGTSSPIVSKADCSGETAGICIDSDDHRIYRWSGAAMVDVGTSSGDDLGTATSADVAALFSGSGDYLKSDGSKGTPTGTLPADPDADAYLKWNDTSGAAEWDATTVDTLADPNADRIIFWDESAGTGGQHALLAPTGGLEIDGTNLQNTAATQSKYNRYHQTADFDPDLLHSTYGGYLVLDAKTAAAITLSEFYAVLNQDPTTEVTFELYFKAAAIDFSGGTAIGSGTTTAGVLTINSGWTDNTIPAGSKVWLAIGSNPDEGTVHASVALTGSYD